MSRIFLRWGKVAVPIVVVVMIAASSPAVGHAVTSQDGSTSWDGDGGAVVQEFLAEVGGDVMNNQFALGDLKSWIIAQPEVSTSGYIDQVNDAATRSVRLLWYGTDPFLTKVLTHASALNIAASVEHRSMSLSEIKSAAARIFDDKDSLTTQGFILNSVAGVSADFDGLSVEGAFVGPLSSSSHRSVQRSTMSARTALASKISELNGGVAVKLVDGVDTVPAVSTRSKDTSPFRAGGYMLSSNGVCSTGFALKKSGTTYITTARHCRGTWKARSNSSTSYGSNYSYSPDGAASMLNRRGKGRTFDGAWNNSSGYSKAVAGYFDASLGDLLCTSGGNSGVHCDLKVNNMWVFWDDGHGRVANIRAKRTTGTIAAIQGDSGGPVFVPRADGKVSASGMIQALWGTTHTGSWCGSAHDLGTNKCGSAILFTSIKTIANAYGASLVTG